MNKVELNQTLRRITKIFYLIGVWRTEQEPEFRSTGRKLFYMMYYILFQVFLVTCAILSESRNEAFFLGAVEVFLSVVTIKLMYLLWKKDDIYEFLFDSIVSQLFVNSDTSEIVNDLKNFLKFLDSYLLMLVVSFIFYIVSTLPMFTDGRKLPFFIKFSMVGRYSEIIYWTAYAFVICGIAFGFTCTLLSTLIWYIMFNYSLKYRLLGIGMKNLGRVTTSNHLENVQPSRDQNFYRDMISLIKIHHNLFKYPLNYRFPLLTI